MTDLPPALRVGLLLAVPIWALRRPGRGVWAVALVAGWLCGAADAARAGRCPAPRDGLRASVDAMLLTTPRAGSARLRTQPPCVREVRVTSVPDDLQPGSSVRVRGRWRQGRGRPWLVAEAWEPRTTGGGASALTARWRASLVVRLERLFGERAPLVSALVLAERDGLDPALREAFARSGTAHLLAISGFHVGVIAALALGALRALRIRRRRAGLAAAAATVAYVALIGFPDAAARAALIVVAAALARARGRPAARFGALGSAAALLLLHDPERIGEVGFQLSFAGAAGLLAWGDRLRQALVAGGRLRMPGPVAEGLAAGIAATLATLPIVAWHFERVSVVGIPVTLLASPVVALALPGALATLALDTVAPGPAAFLAGGVDVLLTGLEHAVESVSRWPHSSVWVSRRWVLVGGVGVAAAWLRTGPTRVRGRARRGVALLWACTALAAWPLLLTLSGRGTVEIVAIDVGQGDAIAVRSPAGRWMLVDAGPPARGDPAAGSLARWLRARGVGRLEALVLTHADADHVGGAAYVLDHLSVGAVLDPSRAVGKQEYVELLERARAAGVPWIRARAGDGFELDGVRVEVLHPGPSTVDAPGPVETNDASVVLRLRWGAFDALLTGDVSAHVERSLAADLEGGVELLKVAHHGSSTSTDPELLRRAEPEVSLISVGRANRYGHPAADVVGRLERAGTRIHRTDREGTIRVRGRADGRYEVRTARPAQSGRVPR